MKVCILVGTRPEIIKMSSVIHEIDSRNIDYFVLHTGQHYSYEMDKIFYKNFDLKEPKYNLELKSSDFLGDAGYVGGLMQGIEKVLFEEKPNVVLVQGDTNTVLAGALTTNKMKTLGINVKLGHVEAGLRSFDINMTEENNRVMTDHISDFLFVPSEKAKENILNENISSDLVYNTGNTIIDVVRKYKDVEMGGDIYEKYGVKEKEFFLLTFHRQENVDNAEKLKELVSGLNLISEKYSFQILCPIHPRTRKALGDNNLVLSEKIKIIEPVDFFESVILQKGARLIITDSGGIQEESVELNTPCVTLRENTERPETVTKGYNILVGADKEKLVSAIDKMLSVELRWEGLYGDGDTAIKIVDILLDKIKG